MTSVHHPPATHLPYGDVGQGSTAANAGNRAFTQPLRACGSVCLPEAH
jgi:hypothetical protein